MRPAAHGLRLEHRRRQSGRRSSHRGLTASFQRLSHRESGAVDQGNGVQGLRVRTAVDHQLEEVLVEITAIAVGRPKARRGTGLSRLSSFHWPFRPRRPIPDPGANYRSSVCGGRLYALCGPCGGACRRAVSCASRRPVGHSASVIAIGAVASSRSIIDRGPAKTVGFVTIIGSQFIGPVRRRGRWYSSQQPRPCDHVRSLCLVDPGYGERPTAVLSRQASTR